jgi:predicted HicB family RNase H-like nuclease
MSETSTSLGAVVRSISTSGHTDRRAHGRRGRRPLAPTEKCSKAFLFRLRPDDDAQIRAAANMLGESVAEFVRVACLRRAEQATADYSDIAKCCPAEGRR